MSSRPIRYCPYCGVPTQHKKLFGETRATCPECGWIHFTDPKVAVAVIIEKEDEILLVRRINEPHRGDWSLPAGFLNAHEDPLEAARRECYEETGLKIDITDLLGIFSGREHPHGADILIVYRAIINGGKLAAGDDADRASFHNIEELPPLAFSTTKIIIDRFSK